MGRGYGPDSNLLEEEVGAGGRFSLIPQERKDALLEHVEHRPLERLDDLSEDADHPGVYLLYMVKPTGPYAPLAGREKEVPIYVGKAENGSVRKRLDTHLGSIRKGDGLEEDSIRCRFVPMESKEEIASAEQLLLAQHKPVWNDFLTGFGNKVVGKRRQDQKPSRWDTVHHGRGRTNSEGQDPEYRAGILEQLTEQLSLQIAALDNKSSR